MAANTRLPLGAIRSGAIEVHHAPADAPRGLARHTHGAASSIAGDDLPCATAVCLIAPALGFATTDRMTWSYVLLGGMPLSMMAVLLAAVHRGYRLVDGYSWTAMAWTAGATLILMPLEIWVPPSLTRWV